MSSKTNKSFREVEYSTVSQCPFEIKDNDDVDDVAAASSRMISSIPGAYIRLAPMERSTNNNKRSNNKTIRWVDTIHFNDLLQIPEQPQQTQPPSSVNDMKTSADEVDDETKNADEGNENHNNSSSSSSSFVLQWQGMAREGMAVALSPNKQGHVLGESLFEIIFGANGNTATILQQRGLQVKKDNATAATAAYSSSSSNMATMQSTPGRVCQERAWTPYWICSHQETLYAGVGDEPGQQCVGMMRFVNNDTPCTNNNNNKIRFIGLGNAGIGDRDKPAMSLKVRNIRLLLSSSSSTSGGQLIVPDSISSALMAISAQANNNNNNNNNSGGMTIVHLGQEEIPAEQKILLEEHEIQCTKARLRAEKFGLPYKEPPLTNSMAWSQVRRLKANPKQGFITGMDLADPTEMAKQQARKQRFGGGSITEAGAEESKDSNNVNGDDDGNGNKSQQLRVPEDSKQQAAARASTGVDKALPVTQAWENEEFVRSQRTDPPTCLWKLPPTDAEDDLNNADKKNGFAMEAKDPPTHALEKVHIFSLDLAAFKQIRNNDLMAYFGVYSPTYIEWLGDFSANIHFQDQYSAARALQNLSQELPSPPPPPPPPLGDDDDSKNVDLSNNEEDKDSDRDRKEKDQDELKSISGKREENQKEVVDLGRMGWRLGNTLVRKISNDRHGRRGTTARILLRMATSLDVLQERPSSWAKIPGFSTQRVLGPTKMSILLGGHHGHGVDNGSTSSAGRNNSKRRRSKKRERVTTLAAKGAPEKKTAGNKHQQSGKKKNDDGGIQSLINCGLRASRSGFSVEEMEAERARKRAKTTSQD